MKVAQEEEVELVEAEEVEVVMVMLEVGVGMERVAKGVGVEENQGAKAVNPLVEEGICWSYLKLVP